jgi:hypothetical protein
MIGVLLGRLSQLLQLEAHSRFSATGAFEFKSFLCWDVIVYGRKYRASWTKSSRIGLSLGSR